MPEHEPGELVIMSSGPGVWFQPTSALRWRNGILEQMWQGSDGSQRWEPVPTVNDETT